MHAIDSIFRGHCAVHGTLFVWGDPAITETIYVDGFPLEDIVNLASAIRYIRETSVRPILDSFWADGICINQRSLSERGHQVALMGSLYSKATLVISWLGMSDSNEGPFLEEFHRLGSTLISKPQDEDRTITNWLDTLYEFWH